MEEAELALRINADEFETIRRMYSDKEKISDKVRERLEVIVKFGKLRPWCDALIVEPSVGFITDRKNNATSMNPYNPKFDEGDAAMAAFCCSREILERNKTDA